MQKTLTKLILVSALLGFAGCSKKEENKTIVVGASSTPHALILNQAKDYIESKGYKLDIKVFDDYVLPNYALESGELDANYFQHEPYLNEFNESNGTHLVSVLKVHFEPMGIYKGRKTALEYYVPGDKFVIPSDKSNHDRAIELLKANNINDAEIVEVEAQSIPLMLEDCDYAVINGNYALSSGVINDCLVTEDKTSKIAEKMANIIAVKSGNEDLEKIAVLKEALKQPNIDQYIEAAFGSSVIYML